MSKRLLTQFETVVAQQILSSSSVHRYEFAAFLESPDGPMIGGLQTDMQIDGVQPSEEVITRANQGIAIIIHHNHLSQESLSNADWNGLITYFHETFAHSEDGTTYWGRVLDKKSVLKVLEAYDGHEMNATTLLCNTMFQHGIYRDTLTNEATFFRKEIINRAMQFRGFVEYDVSWGNGTCPPRGKDQWIQNPVRSIGPAMDLSINIAAQQLAPSL